MRGSTGFIYSATRTTHTCYNQMLMTRDGL